MDATKDPFFPAGNAAFGRLEAVFDFRNSFGLMDQVLQRLIAIIGASPRHWRESMGLLSGGVGLRKHVCTFY